MVMLIIVAGNISLYFEGRLLTQHTQEHQDIISGY